MIDTKIRFKGRRVLVENDPALSEEQNRASVRKFQRIMEKKVLNPLNEACGLDLSILSPQPEVAYDEITHLRKRN